MKESVEAAVITASFGVISTLGAATMNRLSAREQRSVRLTIVEEATREVTFWQTWLQAQLIVCPERADAHKEVVRDQLEKSSVRMLEAKALPAPAPAPVAQHDRRPRSWFHQLLLFYRPERRAAWIPRVFFYAFLFWVVIFFIGVMAEPGPAGFGVLTGTLALAFMFRQLAVSIEQQPH